MRSVWTAIVLLACAATAHAQGGTSALKGHNTNAPVDVAADRIEVQDRADRAVFSGNVIVKQAEMTLTAPRLTVAYANGGGASGGTGGSGVQIQRLDASGGVTIVSPTETARGEFAIYDLNSKIITMLGGVTLTRGQSHVSGPRLVIDLNTGRAVMDSGSGGGSAPGTAARGGRVTGTFTVPQRNNQSSQTQGKAAPKQ